MKLQMVYEFDILGIFEKSFYIQEARAMCLYVTMSPLVIVFLLKMTPGDG